MENLGKHESEREFTNSPTKISLDEVDIVRSTLGARYLNDTGEVQKEKNLQSNHHISESGFQHKHAGLSKNERKGQRYLHNEHSDKTVKNSPTPPKVLKNSLFNTETMADPKSQLVKNWNLNGDRELKSPISFDNNERLLNVSSMNYRTGRHSAPLFNKKGYGLSEVYSNHYFSLRKPLLGSEKADSAKPSNVLKRIVGRQAINLFYKTKPERPQSVSQSSKSSSEVYSIDQIIDPNLERSYSDNALQRYLNMSEPQKILEDFKRTSYKIKPSTNFQDSSLLNVTDPHSVKYLEATNSSFLENQILEDSLTQSDENLEKKPLIEKTKADSRTHVYKKRWYLLFLFSLTAMLWSAVWSTWGPIAQSAKNVYDFDDADIAMFTWLGNIPFLVTMFPIAYLMDVKGMRTAMILCCGLIFLGAGVRCIPSDNLTTKWLIYAGQLLNGIAGTVPMSGSALLSGLWFPSNQRATATAISTIAGYFGASVSFVIGPLFVPENDDPSSNLTYTYDIFLSSGNDSDIAVQKSHIEYILYSECGAAGLLFLLVIVYFPSKPVVPPSISASMPREKYLDGLKMLIRNRQFWVTAIAFSFPAGVYEAWQVVLDVNLDPKVSQTTAGWMDFYATVGGCVSGMLVSRFADYFTRQMKLFLLIFYFLAAIAFLWCTFIVTNILPFDTVSLYAAIILGGVFLDGAAPLFFELVIEVSYPVGEGVTSGCVQMICSLAGIVFLSVVQINTTDKQWMNWCFLGTITMAIPLLFLVKATYGRADIDDLEVSVEEDSQSVNQ